MSRAYDVTYVKSDRSLADRVVVQHYVDTVRVNGKVPLSVLNADVTAALSTATCYQNLLTYYAWNGAAAPDAYARAEGTRPRLVCQIEGIWGLMSVICNFRSVALTLEDYERMADVDAIDRICNRNPALAVCVLTGTG